LTDKRKILVTSALPYANNSLHIGHLVEYVQTDVWVRFQRMRGHDCIYVCASDAHGTPTMLRAEKLGIDADQLIEQIVAEHRRDFATFRISVDNYLSTHAPENKYRTGAIYENLRDAGLLDRRSIRQAYDESKQMFLPDRYVRGTCPACKTPDQNGDSCENCSATYAPLDMIDPVSVISGSAPVARESEHLFFKLSQFSDRLQEWIPEHVDQAMARKLQEWFDAGLQDWDFTRDAPYFGFEVPGEPGKFFYVWFDAPIGYIASFDNYCQREGVDFGEYWNADSKTELYHFIGKDIVYFHALFWPAMLWGAGYRVPTGIFTHGFLTVNGAKMSKSRGTNITMAQFAEHIDPDYLRYYYASKLGGGIDDIDFSFADFVARVNSDLVGKLVNIASRCAGFVHKINAGVLADKLHDEALFEEFKLASDDIAADYERRDYSKAVRKIMAFTDRANQYIDEHKPWQLAKSGGSDAEVLGVCTLGLNLFRTLITWLKPIIPDVAARSEQFLAAGELDWSSTERPLLGTRIEKFHPLLERLDPKVIELLITVPEPLATTEPEPSDLPAEIDLESFLKVDLRVAEVLSAAHVDGADKLLKLELDLGDGRRSVFAGIRSAYDPDSLVGRQLVVVANLKPRKMRFGTSEGMVLAAGPGGEEIFLLSPDSGAKAGMRVR
jgi:methionyl-tRNA synthetase